jgi:hypothetical protein
MRKSLVRPFIEELAVTGEEFLALMKGTELLRNPA